MFVYTGKQYQKFTKKITEKAETATEDIQLKTLKIGKARGLQSIFQKKYRAVKFSTKKIARCKIFQQRYILSCKMFYWKNLKLQSRKVQWIGIKMRNWNCNKKNSSKTKKQLTVNVATFLSHIFFFPRFFVLKDKSCLYEFEFPVLDKFSHSSFC